jgi:dihydropyrimidinase
VPGIQARMPLLFSEGVGRGRITLNEFVALTSTNHAKMYGIAPQKGTLEPGCDADIAIWDPQREVTLTASMMKDNAGYTPYEGRVVRGWPVQVLLRGRLVVDDGALLAERGSGRFVPCGTPAPLAGAAQRRDNAAGAFRRLIAS